MNAKQTIEFAREYPFDERAPTDAAHLAALAVLADLSDRRSISAQLESLDDDIKTEIVDTLTEIIRQVINYGKEVCEDCNGSD